MRKRCQKNHARFQSTLSVRRATARHGKPRLQMGISIHALRKESDNWAFNDGSSHVISIHALRKESDPPDFGQSTDPDTFQSTLSVRRATVCPFVRIVLP